MINHRLFVKGEQIHALLTSYSHPNILIPVKAIVRDVKYNDVNPQYTIKVIEFFDNISFLKKYLLNMSFSSTFDKRARNLNIDKNGIKTREDLLEIISDESNKQYFFVVDSIMTKKYKGEIVQLFNKIQDHLIEIKLRECREHMTRTKYTGKYKLTGHSEFNARLKKFIGDKIEESGISTEDFFRLL
jgi:hypothetical protein